MTSQAIRKLRLGLGWSQQQLADYLCLSSRNRVCEMERDGYVADGTIKMLLACLARNVERAIVSVDALTAEPKMVTPAQLKRIRERKRMTQAAFALLLGVTWGYVSDLENGKRHITRRLSRLVKTLEK